MEIKLKSASVSVEGSGLWKRDGNYEGSKENTSGKSAREPVKDVLQVDLIGLEVLVAHIESSRLRLDGN